MGKHHDPVNLNIKICRKKPPMGNISITNHKKISLDHNDLTRKISQIQQYQICSQFPAYQLMGIYFLLIPRIFFELLSKAHFWVTT